MRECNQKLTKKWSKTKKGRMSHRKAKQKYQKTKNAKRLAKNYNLIYRYNITLEQYDEMFEQQNGVCAICGLPEIARRLCVDHSHKTRKVRGLLCQGCNFSLGIYEKWKKQFEKYLRGI